MAIITQVRLTIAAFIYAIEEDLRNIIKSSIIPFNSNLAFFQNSDLAKTVTERFLKDNPGADPNANLTDTIEFLDFGDSYKIILKNKNYISNQVFNSIKALSKQLELIIPIRNRVMHTRPLLGGDYVSIFAIVSEIKNQHAEYWENVTRTLELIENDPSYIFNIQLRSHDIKKVGIEHNLPYPDFDETGFIGRVKDVESIKHLILNTNVVSVIGDGGIGKTALMLKVAYDIIDMQNCPFEVVIWVSAKTTMLTTKGVEDIENALRGYDEVLNGIAKEFENKSENSLAENIASILNYISSFKTLLIIDNLETIQTEEMREFIRVAQTKCKIAITSRVGLGELEYPVKLEGLTDSESVKMIREIARLRNDNFLLKLEQSILVGISKKLYHNPLALKWFVNSVNAGKTPNEVLQNKDDLLKFCLSNVYDKLSNNCILVLNVIRAARKTVNDAEIIFVSELTPLACRKSVIELITTTLVARSLSDKSDAQEVKYQITEFANDYLLRYHPLEASFVVRIGKKIKDLNDSAQRDNQRLLNNEFDKDYIICTNSNERIVSHLLNEAFALSKKGQTDAALSKTDEARSILPNYHEIYRVSAFIKAAKNELLGADEDYKSGLEIAPNDIRLLFYYGQFLLFKMQDTEAARKYVERVHTLRPDHPNTILLIARVNATSYNYEESYAILLEFIASYAKKSSKEWRIAIADAIKTCDRWVNAKAHIEGDYNRAITAFELGVGVYEIASNAENVDSTIADKFCKLLITTIADIPAIYLDKQIPNLSELIIRHQHRLSFSKSYMHLLQKFKELSGIDLLRIEDIALEDKFRGFITQYKQDKSFLFIETESGNRYYAHRHDFVNITSWQELADDSVVYFDLGENRNGTCAVNIVLVSSDSIDYEIE